MRRRPNPRGVWIAPALCAASVCAVVACPRHGLAAPPAQRASVDPQPGPLVPVSADDDPHDEFEAFPLVVPHEKHHLRASLEVGSVVVVGFIDYLLNTAARGGLTREGDQRWSLRYDWEDLRGKLVGTAWELDANRFNTNYLGHPFAGVMYYTTARANHLSFGESWMFATVGSFVWDMFGEIRERMSINDSIVTPTSGAAIGEAMMQLSGFFDRATRSPHSRTLSILFAPVKAINYLFDGAEPRRTTHPGAFGFPTEPWHRFSLHAGTALVAQEGTRVGAGPGATRPSATYADVAFGVSFETANLPGYAGAGRHARLFDDGNVSSIAFDAAISRGDLVHARFATRVIPAGYYYRDAVVDSRGHVSGSGSIVGFRVGFEYGVHDFDRDRARASDLVSFASPLGVAAEHTFERGGLRLRTGLDVYGAMAGVRPYALAEFRASLSDDRRLPIVTQNNGYYHGLSVTVEPRVRVTYGELELGAALRLDTMHAVRWGEESAIPEEERPAMDDRRTAIRGTLGWEPSAVPLHLSISAQRYARYGNVGASSASRSETAYGVQLGWVF